MKPPIREVTVKVLVHATEDENKIMEALKNFLPAKIRVERVELEGHYGNPLVLLKARVKGKEMEEVLSFFLDKIENLASLFPKFDQHLDKEGNLYLRLDKQEACRGRWVLKGGDEVIHLTLKSGSLKKKELLEFLRTKGGKWKGSEEDT
ncbi:MAG: RNA-binding domain-containing protein [Candidatus Hadarchaeales archaeon]